MSEESVETTATPAVACEAKILFRQLKPFPVIDENNNFKIETDHFLESSNQIIDAIDMRQNVQKIADKYKQNETMFKYLEDLILKDKDGNDVPFDTVTDGLLWLKRAFEMMEQFFRNLLQDETCSEQVKPHLKKAYEECLLPYHGFLAQKAFQLLHLYLPTRSSLLGPSASNADNLKALEDFLVLFPLCLELFPAKCGQLPHCRYANDDLQRKKRNRGGLHHRCHGVANGVRGQQ
uniref:Glycolipid transfer protein domain-containing protein n=1 Tax=Anopheles culicifacies TaxID=139723 RepID=A0A182LUF9_9DIPT